MEAGETVSAENVSSELDNLRSNERISPPLYSAIDLSFLSTQRRERLVKRLKRGLKYSILALHVLYCAAVIMLVSGFWFFSVFEWIAKRLGLAVGEGMCISAALIFITSRYRNGMQLLKRAKKSLGRTRFDDDVFDVIADALKKFAKRLFETLGLVVSAWVAPFAIKAPDTLARAVPDTVQRDDARHVMRGFVGALSAALAFGAVYAYEAAQAATMKLIDDVVDHVDDMEQFDFLSADEESDSDASTIDNDDDV